MRKGWIIGGALLLLVLLGVLALGGQYNTLVQKETAVDAQWAQVQNQLQRRADLIPNLVNTVKGYAKHEQEVFSNIAAARSQLLAARGPEEAARANQNVDSWLGRLLALVENYPQLKADATFTRLMDELAGTENRIAVERMRYNQSVRDWNATIRVFPTVILASLLGKAPRQYFQAQPGTEQAPQVNF